MEREQRETERKIRWKECRPMRKGKGKDMIKIKISPSDSTDDYEKLMKGKLQYPCESTRRGPGPDDKGSLAPKTKKTVESNAQVWNRACGFNNRWTEVRPVELVTWQVPRCPQRPRRKKQKHEEMSLLRRKKVGKHLQKT